MKKVNLTEWLSKGLNGDKDNPDGVGACQALWNAEPTPNGLIQYEAPTAPFELSEVVPHPQLFAAANENLVIYNQAIHNATTAWTSIGAALTIYKPADYTAIGVLGTASGSIPSGNIWHFADLGKGWFAYNANCSLFRIPNVGIFCDSTRYANTGSAWRGRLWQGGLSAFLASSWLSTINGYRTKSSTETISLGDNWVWWSSVGYDDVLWMHFNWMLEDETFHRVLERHEFGFMQLPNPGKVLALRPLGDYMMAYGPQGIDALAMRDGKVSLLHLADFGIPYRGCVGGSEKEHLLISNEGFVWKIGADLKMTHLDFSTVLATRWALTSHTNIIYDDSRGDYYLGISGQALKFTPNGVTQIEKRLTGFVNYEGSRFAAWDYTNNDHKKFYLETGVVRVDSFANCIGVSIHADDSSVISCKVYARRNAGDSFYSESGTFDSAGVCRLSIPGREFYVELSTSSGVYASVYKLELMFADDAMFKIGELL